MQKTHFLDILVVLRLDFGQISFNLVENAFATQKLAVLATSIAFYDILARACTEINEAWFFSDLDYSLRHVPSIYEVGDPPIFFCLFGKSRS